MQTTKDKIIIVTLILIAFFIGCLYGYRIAQDQQKALINTNLHKK